MKLTHEYDNDGCCIHCDFDGAEAHSIRSGIHPDDREPPEHYEVYCDKRTNVEPTVMEDEEVFDNWFNDE